MFKSLIIVSVFATGVTLPSVADIQPVEGATLTMSQFSLNWSESGFEVEATEHSDFAFTLNLSGDRALSLKL